MRPDSPSQNQPAPDASSLPNAIRNYIGIEWNGIVLTASLSSVPHRIPFPCHVPVPGARKHSNCNIAKHMKKLCSATSKYKYCNIAKLCSAISKNMYYNIEKYVLQLQKLCTATSKIIYYNIEKHLLQHRKTCIATSKNMCYNIKNYVLQHRKICTATS
jgi:hypothetical protein